MNRFKKEIRKKGVKLECDYPHIPFEYETGFTVVRVIVNTEHCMVIFEYDVAIAVMHFDRAMKPHEQSEYWW